MSRPKIVIVVLVLLVVVFAVTVGVSSFRGGDAEFDLDNAWVKALQRAFPTKSLDLERIDSQCFADSVFTIPKDRDRCPVTIEKGGVSICDLKLKLIEGQASLEYEPNSKDEHGLPIERRALEMRNPYTLQISKGGGTLTLFNDSDSSQPCRIEIKK